MSYTGYTYLNFQVNESITSPLVSNPSFSICSKVISKSFSFVALKISSSCQQKNSTSNEVFLGDRKEHTSELQSRPHLVCRLLLEKKKKYLTKSCYEFFDEKCY